MISPYDWQEGVSNRAQYIEGRLAQGLPVLAISLNEGLLMYSRRRQSRKVFEIYDRIIFAGLGQQSDLEAIRAAALEFASREGYQRSEDDVTVQRVATTVSGPIKQAFADFRTAPVVARTMFGELGETPEKDTYYVIDFDGDYAVARLRSAIAGTLESGSKLETALAAIPASTDPEEAILKLSEIFDSSFEGPVPEGLKEEAILIERNTLREDRFRVLRAVEGI